MIVRNDACPLGDTNSCSAPPFPCAAAVDALLFRAAPSGVGSLDLHWALAVSAGEGISLTWRPGLAEGAMAELLRRIRDFLGRCDAGSFPTTGTTFHCGGPGTQCTLILQRLPGGLVLGAALASAGRGTSGGEARTRRSEGCSAGEPTAPVAAGDAVAVLTDGSPRCGDEPSAAETLLLSAGHVQERLRRLPGDSRQLVQAVAVLGGRVAVPRLGTIVHSPEHLAHAVQVATEAGLLRWHARSGSVEVPETLRPLVRADMTRSERQASHAWAARWSDGPETLVHRAAVASVPSPSLAEELEAEADRLGAQGRSAQAARLLHHAAELSPDTTSATRRRLKSVEHELRLHHCATAGAGLRALRQHPPSAYQLLLSGRLSVLEGHLHRGLELMTEAYDRLLAEGAGSPEQRAEALEAAATWLAHARWLAGCPTEDISPLLDESRISASLDPYWRDFRAWLETLLVARDKSVVEALERIPRAMPSIRPRSASARRRALLTEAWLRLAAGELHQCESTVHRALDLSEISEAAAADGLPLVVLGHLHWLRGHWALAQVHATMVTNTAAPLWRPMGDALSLLVGASRGEVRHGGTDQPAGTDEQPVFGARTQLFATLVAAVETRDASRARAALRTLTSPRTAVPLSSPLMPWCELEVLRAAILVDDSALTERALQSIRRLRRQPATAWIEMFVAWGEGLAAAHADRRDEALSCYEKAERHAADIEFAPWFRARLQADHAELLAEAGRRRASLDRYRVAQEAAVDLGAEPLVERCIAGLSRLKLPGSAVGFGLTPRELDVVALVAEGMRNKEVATRLFVTPASVAFHLRNVYAKTGVRNRYELRAWWQSLNESD